ncbi:MAG: PAS domain-containing protein, partial [Melioribacteraceae bacterium]|nr:PAS domain-containing protein [Melioribacteraceae bacterium]
MSKNNLNKLISDKFLLEKVEQLIEERIKFELDQFTLSFKKLFFAQAKNGKDNHIEYSKSIKDVIGYSAEDIEELPNKLASIIHEDDRLRIRNCMNDFLAGNSGNEISISYRIINNHEEEVWLNENLQAEFDN